LYFHAKGVERFIQIKNNIFINESNLFSESFL